jgi:hypothetical protein
MRVIVSFNSLAATILPRRISTIGARQDCSPGRNSECGHGESPGAKVGSCAESRPGWDTDQYGLESGVSDADRDARCVRSRDGERAGDPAFPEIFGLARTLALENWAAAELVSTSLVNHSNGTSARPPSGSLRRSTLMPDLSVRLKDRDRVEVVLGVTSTKKSRVR